MKKEKRIEKEWQGVLKKLMTLAVANYNNLSERGSLAETVISHIKYTEESEYNFFSFVLTPDGKQLIAMNFKLDYIRAFDDPEIIRKFTACMAMKGNPSKTFFDLND